MLENDSIGKVKVTKTLKLKNRFNKKLRGLGKLE
jgi:hypothetical protein